MIWCGRRPTTLISLAAKPLRSSRPGFWTVHDVAEFLLLSTYSRESGTDAATGHLILTQTHYGPFVCHSGENDVIDLLRFHSSTPRSRLKIPFLVYRLAQLAQSSVPSLVEENPAFSTISLTGARSVEVDDERGMTLAVFSTIEEEVCFAEVRIEVVER